MSVTWNSSKHSSQLSSASAAAVSWIGSSPLPPALMVLAELPHVLVHVGHEFMEVHAPLAPDRRRLEEQVHQHGLAAADLAMDVEPLDWLLLALAGAEQPAERGRFPRQAMLAQAAFQFGEKIDRARLRHIPLDLSGRDQRLVPCVDAGRHGWCRHAASG